VGLPSTSAFARVFQFGMRLGMRSYTLGSAWWQGDCGPYWGHNAVLRLAPFIAHCALPVLSRVEMEDRHILSHDQIEAALMRAAGYDVRVLPQEDLGWEENPPTLIEFIRRDLRWCQGNMQYWRFLFLPGLRPVSRYQLALAILIWFLPLSYANGVTQYVLISLRRQGSITVSFAIAAIFNLVANLLLIPLYGYFAAAAITVATEVVILLPFLRTLRQEEILPPLLALAWRPAVAALVMGAAMLAIRNFDPQALVPALAAAVAAPPVYLAALWLLGAFGVEERALMRRVLGRV